MMAAGIDSCARVAHKDKVYNCTSFQRSFEVKPQDYIASEWRAGGRPSPRRSFALKVSIHGVGLVATACSPTVTTRASERERERTGGGLFYLWGNIARGMQPQLSLSLSLPYTYTSLSAPGSSLVFNVRVCGCTYINASSIDSRERQRG